MGEVDYQMALLLQYRLEQQHKRKEDTDSDYKLALELQEQFKDEVAVERPKDNLVYKAPRTANDTKCLVDPSWEVIDPTPDVHVLFMAFNQRFFWNSLGSVTVAWSKRMTTCAGICSYQGRGGMCSITLSEPLLKLRPRKDLVETLLHEMIHAHLFVTNNNRDRDGHGPEFHKHMNRINAEAGTNITVYHDFHDEVRLYQQHWWRCDGPCQNRKPYFGMVRRAINRAPGPNDQWWEEHVRNCGGTFIKVKSPEKKEKPSKSSSMKNKDPPTQPNPKNDIRNYISNSNSPTLPKTNQNSNNNVKPVLNNAPTLAKVAKPVNKNTNTTSLPNNVRTVSNNTASTPQVSNVIPSKTSNIFGFTNLSGTGNTSKKPGNASGVKGAVKNAGSSTFVVTNKGRKTSTTTTTDAGVPSEKPRSSSVSDITPFAGEGRTLSSSSVSSPNNSDYSVVRDHWLKRFGNSLQNDSQRTNFKRPNENCPSASPKKLPKLSKSEDDDNDKVECPVCGKKFRVNELNSHLDKCLESPCDNKKECIICGVQIALTDYEKHVVLCTEKNFSDNDTDEVILLDSPCPKKSDAKETSKNCPVCKIAVESNRYDVHVQNCILGMCDEFDKKYDIDKNPKTSCLACGKQIIKSELDSHLEDCMSMSNVFDTSNVPVEDSDEECDNLDNKNDTSSNGRYNCPFCLELVVEDKMQGHLDTCLNNDTGNHAGLKEKSLLVESPCSNDSDSD